MKHLYRIFAVAFVVALAVGVWVALRDQDWSPVAQMAQRISPAQTVAVLAIAMLINMAGLVLGLLGWRALFLDLGATVSGWTAMRLCFVGFLAKFVPGRLLALPVLLRMSREIELGAVRMASVFMLSWAIAAFTGLTIGLAAGPGVAGLSIAWLPVAAVPLALMLWRPGLLAGSIALAERLLRRPPSPVRPSGSGARQAIIYQSASWFVSGHHLWLLAVVAGAPPGKAYLLCVAGFAVAATAGVLVLVVPDGIGVREAILVAALSTVLPLPLATTVTLASRLACTLGEIVIGSGGLALAQWKHQRLNSALSSS